MNSKKWFIFEDNNDIEKWNNSSYTRDFLGIGCQYRSLLVLASQFGFLRYRPPKYVFLFKTYTFYQCLEPPSSKIEQFNKSWNGGCDEHETLYWFRPLERNTLRPVWEYVSFIDLWGLKYGAQNRGEYKLGSLSKCVLLVLVTVFVWLEPPFIGNQEGPTNYPCVYHKCSVLTYTADSPLCQVTRVPASELGVIIMLCPVPSYSLKRGAPGENPCFLSMHDVPSIGSGTPPAPSSPTSRESLLIMLFCRPTSRVGHQVA
jgi:hypothetical protein